MYAKITALRIVITTLFLATLTLVILSKGTPYFEFDLQVSKTVQSFNPNWFDFIMRFLSSLGNGLWPVIITLFSSLIVAGLGRKKDALLIVVSFIGTSLISLLIKGLVARPRPTSDLVDLLTTAVESPSFPSGHVLFAMGLFGFLSFLVYTEAKISWVRNLLLVTFLSAIILMGVSRIYLGVHWFSDVLGSYLVGTIWLYFMSVLYKKTINLFT